MSTTHKVRNLEPGETMIDVEPPLEMVVAIEDKLAKEFAEKCKTDVIMCHVDIKVRLNVVGDMRGKQESDG